MHPDRDPAPAYARTGEVDTIDGFLMVLSPWAVRNLRFDESLGRFHGYDFDLCLQARAAGRKVVTADLKVVHHHSLDLLGDAEGWVEANLRVTEKWAERFPQLAPQAEDGDWRGRARRSDAEAAAARTLRIAAQMKAEARERELLRELDMMRSSLSWRITAPLRRATRSWRALKDRAGR
jgi:GT2 family glycosyltransferase